MQDLEKEMLKNKDLQAIKSITIALESISHPDSYRIAREIYDYTKGNEQEIAGVLARLKLNEPWEYIRGTAGFMDLVFKVSPATLIPRLETEELVKIALHFITSRRLKFVVDVGTGSGAIAVSIAKYLPEMKITATDLSSEALKMAQINVNNYVVANRVKLVNTNLIENINDINNDTLIIVNLPYIPTHLYHQLDSSVKDYEPRTALVGGLTGTDYIEELLRQVSRLSLQPNTILLEIDPSISDRVSEVSKKILPDYITDIRKDFRSLDRFAILTIRPLQA